MTNSRRIGIAAAVILVVALSGSAAVGAGKITSKQIAKNAVLAKHIKTGAVGTTELADGSVTGPKLADGSVTGAKVDESTLGTVPNATAVGGMKVIPLSASLPDGATGISLYNANGLHVIIDCGTPVAGKANTEFVGVGAPISVDASRTGEADLTQTYPADGGVALRSVTGHLTVTVSRPGGAVTLLELNAFYLTNAIGTDDCFFRGILSTTP